MLSGLRPCWATIPSAVGSYGTLQEPEPVPRLKPWARGLSPLTRLSANTGRGCNTLAKDRKQTIFSPPMLTGEPESQTALRQLERILASPGFARNARLSGFLRYVVESHLMGKDSELKESLVAIEVFGRSPDYDPKQDPIVRTEAIRLRARLGEYYLGEGKDDSLIIELRKGGYIPVIRPAEGRAE